MESNKIALVKGDVAIHLPTRAGSSSLIKALTPQGWEVERNTTRENNYLLIRHPLKRLISHYKVAHPKVKLKIWATSFPPPPQWKWCPKPVQTLRLEWIAKDLQEELGITAAVPHCNSSPGNPEACATTRAFVRDYYKVDYSMGEYD